MHQGSHHNRKERERVSLSAAVKEALFLRNLVGDVLQIKRNCETYAELRFEGIELFFL